MTSSEKRKVPLVLQKLLKFDAVCSEHFCLWTNQFLPFRSLKVHYKMLELSCHGVPWLAGWLAFIWILNSSNLYQMQVNFYIGLLLDIVFVAVIKALVRRKRPQGHSPDDMLAIGPDKFSFPSGHASRAVYIVYFLVFLYQVPFFLTPPLLAWVISVCLSRVLLRRHHLLDILAGVLLGIFEAVLVSWLWLSHNTSLSLISWLTDEKVDGGEYHV